VDIANGNMAHGHFQSVFLSDLHETTYWSQATMHCTFTAISEVVTSIQSHRKGCVDISRPDECGVDLQ
jgi:hypothetical protein